MADELKTNQTATTAATGTGSSASGTTGTTSAVQQNTNSANDYLNQYNAQRENKIRNLYDTARQNTLQQYKTAYDQNMATQQRAMDKISPQYQEAQNQYAAEYERQRRNNNMQAAANGLNTGAGSQMQLGQMNAYGQGQAQLRKQENEALDNANQNMADLKTNYQNQIAQATAQNDYQTAAALLDEYGKQYERQMTQASQMAEYGDFSMYANIYGLPAAQQMEKTWSLQNPLLAYNLGKLTADEYFKMTGSYPPGYGGGGDGGGGYSGGGGYYYGPPGHLDNNGNWVIDGQDTGGGNEELHSYADVGKTTASNIDRGASENSAYWSTLRDRR